MEKQLKSSTSSTSSSVRLMDFVSQEQLEESKKTRGERVEDGTAQRDRPLYQILKENKDKKIAELNDRRKHRPSKPLDEDEFKFLHGLDASQREVERRLADEEEQELGRFRVAVARSTLNATRSSSVTPAAIRQNKLITGRKDPAACPLSSMFIVKPLAKKARIDHTASEASTVAEKVIDTETSAEPVRKASFVIGIAADKSAEKKGLVTYSDSEDDD
ncbi:hypothetical protein OWV82_003861 [Melia azedarach]|uniref:Uncharacterized protein n=1 Tax=Melia azedarach TaxID=155640 RepID=A0ACC1YME0_MELAZ|nr:hypothetical protein OWV82_003861 [Melia azedarach]